MRFCMTKFTVIFTVKNQQHTQDGTARIAEIYPLAFKREFQRCQE